MVNNILILSFGYTVLSRYYLLLIVTNNFQFVNSINVFILSTNLFLCLVVWTLRLCINYSFYIVCSIEQNNKRLFLTEIEGPSSSSTNPSSPNISPSNPSPNPSNPNPPKFSLFTFNRHHTSFNNRPRFWYTGHLTVTICSVLLGCITTALAYQMLVTTREGNKALDRNTQAMERQSDQVDRDAKIMSLETYLERNSKEYVRLSPAEKVAFCNAIKKNQEG